MGCSTSRTNSPEGDGLEPYEPSIAELTTHIDSPAMGSHSEPTTITILHFNDVYNIEPRDKDPCGGAARFTQRIKDLRHLNPMVLFSGDAFNPSLMSALVKGKQMVPVLNTMNINCACYGNHDFDFGVDNLVKLANQTNFPWLMSNVYDNTTDAPLAEGITKVIIEWQGKKIGLVGLVEEEWIDTLSTIDPDDITFIDYVEEGRRLARELKSEGADYIIALTHMRWPNDLRLAEEVEEIDIFLGGHDHDYGKRLVKGKWVIKSGTDFREMSKVTITFDAENKTNVDIELLEMNKADPEDPEVKTIVEDFLKIMGEKMESVIGSVDVELDGRFANIRTKETNLGNFITDIMLSGTNADVALLNSGTLRSDTLHPKGELKMKDLMSILPMIDPMVVLKISGEKIVAALENGVSQWPKLEGRFPQIAGCQFAFNPEKPPGQRVNPQLVKIQGVFVDLKKDDYRLTTKSYLADGKDGYDPFKTCELLVNDEEGPRLTNLVQNYFKSVKIVKGEKKPKFSHHQSIISVTRRRSLVRQLTLDTNLISPSQASVCSAVSNSSDGRPHSGSAETRRNLFRRRSSIQSMELENTASALAPKEDGRILQVNGEKERLMMDERMAKEVANTTISEGDESQATPTTPNAPVNLSA